MFYRPLRICHQWLKIRYAFWLFIWLQWSVTSLVKLRLVSAAGAVCTIWLHFFFFFWVVFTSTKSETLCSLLSLFTLPKRDRRKRTVGVQLCFSKPKSKLFIWACKQNRLWEHAKPILSFLLWCCCKLCCSPVLTAHLLWVYHGESRAENTLRSHIHSAPQSPLIQMYKMVNH